MFSQEVTLLLDVFTFLPLRFMQVLHVMFEIPSTAQNTVIIEMTTVGLMHMQAKPPAVTEVLAQYIVKLGHQLRTAWASSSRRRLRWVPDSALMPDLQPAWCRRGQTGTATGRLFRPRGLFQTRRQTGELARSSKEPKFNR